MGTNEEVIIRFFSEVPYVFFIHFLREINVKEFLFGVSKNVSWSFSKQRLKHTREPSSTSVNYDPPIDVFNV
jgi:hypothetical protein